MVSGECPSWKAITTESKETPSEPTRSTPWESGSTYLFVEFIRSSEPSFAVAQADQGSLYHPGPVPAIARAQHLAFGLGCRRRRIDRCTRRPSERQLVLTQRLRCCQKWGGCRD